ncbi:MAG: penicillin-binding transpeptidase domain-containing protein [Oscillochloridaceae bacterium umkhey_bin13]
MRARGALRTVCLVAAIGLVAYGIIQPVEGEVRWLIALWAAAPLLGLVAWLSVPSPSQGLPRSVYHLGLVVLVGFCLLSLQLLRQQVVQAEAIYYHVAQGADGSTTSNVRPVLDSQRVLRGRIIDRKGQILVDSEPVNDFARRTYPLAARYDPRAFGGVIGYFSTRYGQSALEASFDLYLTGQRGNEIERLRERLVGGATRGNDLNLTLNADLQAAAAGLLGNRTGSVVVLDPRTGAILALAGTPGFDPQGLSFNPGAPDWSTENRRISAYWEDLNRDAAGRPLLHRPTQGVYPPGSTYKAVTAIGVLEHANQGRPDEITCPENYTPQPGAPPVVNAVSNLQSLTGEPSSLERVFAFSCNTAFAQYSTRLGPDLTTEIARRFDILPPQRTLVAYDGFRELPTAQSRLYADPGFLNYPRALADTGYGQGQLQVTPLQMAMITAAIANDGVMMRPYLVQQITRPDGGIIQAHTPQPIRRTMTAATARAMRSHMAAVAEYGFGRSVDDFTPPGIAVGGKSGTAEHVPGAPPHAWFIAIAPLDAPRFAVAVMVEGGGEGSSVGAELAGRVLAAAFATE